MVSTDTKAPLKAYFALLIVCIVWGLSWIASKEAVRYMPALQMAGIRQIWAGSLYVSYFLYKGFKLPGRQQWIPILFLALVNFVISNGLSTWALKFINAGLGSIIGASFPIWLFIFSTLKYKYRSSLMAWVGIFMGFVGICVVFYDHLADFINPEFTFGIILSLIAALSWTIGTMYTKEHANHFNPYFSIGLQMLCAGVILTVISQSLGWSIPMTSIPAISWLHISFLVVVSSVITFIAYLYILQVLPTSLVSIYAYINPVVAVSVSGLFFGEKVTFIIMVGILITLTGVYFVNLSLRRKHLFSRPPRNRI